MINLDDYRIKPETSVQLSKIPTYNDGGLTKSQIAEKHHHNTSKLKKMQELLFAEGKHSLLVVLQAMDAGGKDSTIRHVFGPLNPEGCRVISFKGPNERELKHDFLWRVHQHTPRDGFMTVFNRSHYEDVLIVRAKKLELPKAWQPRFEHINHFEKMLSDEGTTVVKIFLHISKAYQKKRIQRRIDRPDKHWKLDPSDLEERGRWSKYQIAHNDMLSRCSTDYAPWYVIPAECRSYRNLLVSQVLVDTLSSLKMKYPEPTIDPKSIVLE